MYGDGVVRTAVDTATGNSTAPVWATDKKVVAKAGALRTAKYPLQSQSLARKWHSTCHISNKYISSKNFKFMRKSETFQSENYSCVKHLPLLGCVQHLNHRVLPAHKHISFKLENI